MTAFLNGKTKVFLFSFWKNMLVNIIKVNKDWYVQLQNILKVVIFLMYYIPSLLKPVILIKMMLLSKVT